VTAYPPPAGEPVRIVSVTAAAMGPTRVDAHLPALLAYHGCACGIEVNGIQVRRESRVDGRRRAREQGRCFTTLSCRPATTIHAYYYGDGRMTRRGNIGYLGKYVRRDPQLGLRLQADVFILLSLSPRGIFITLTDSTIKQCSAVQCSIYSFIVKKGRLFHLWCSGRRKMGASISKLFSGLVWGKKDIRILILGLVCCKPIFWKSTLTLLLGQCG